MLFAMISMCSLEIESFVQIMIYKLSLIELSYTDDTYLQYLWEK